MTFSPALRSLAVWRSRAGDEAGQRGVARQGGRAGQGGGADQWGVVQLASAAAGLPAGCCCLHPVSRHGCVQC